MYDMMMKTMIMNMKLIMIMNVSIIMIWYEMLMHWLVVYMCHTPPSSTIFLWISCGDCLEKPIEGISSREPPSCWRNIPRFSWSSIIWAVRWWKIWWRMLNRTSVFAVFLISRFWFGDFFFSPCHVMSTESWCKVEEGIQVPLQGIIKHHQRAGFWKASFSRRGKNMEVPSAQDIFFAFKACIQMCMSTFSGCFFVQSHFALP